MATNSFTAATSIPGLRNGTDVPPVLQMHDILWCEDGNVIFTASDDGRVGFRFKLHRSVLSLHSEFFRDMCSLPHYPGNDEVMDSCPVIHSTDCAQHLAWLFMTLYEGGREYVDSLPLF